VYLYPTGRSIKGRGDGRRRQSHVLVLGGQVWADGTDGDTQTTGLFKDYKGRSMAGNTKLKRSVLNELARSDDDLKTAKMFRLEKQFQMDIRQMLRTGLDGDYVAEMLGVTEGCISRWRKRLGIVI